MKRAIIAGVATLMAMSQAFAADKPKADPPGPTGLDTKEATIPFLDQHSSILDWQANGTTGLWIEDAHKQWYYAEMFAPCIGLDFAVGVGFRNKGAEPAGSRQRDHRAGFPHGAMPVQEPEEERPAAEQAQGQGQGCRCGPRRREVARACGSRLRAPTTGSRAGLPSQWRARPVSWRAMGTRISVELSLYPLTPDYKPPIRDFIARLRANPNLTVASNTMSTQVQGDYDDSVREMRPNLTGSYRVVFAVKFMGPAEKSI